MDDVASDPLQADDPGVGILYDLLLVINEPGQPGEHRQGRQRRDPD